MAEKIILTVSATIHADISKVWEHWTNPASIMIWNTASPDWHTTHSEVDLRIGGKFSSIMAAKDGSISFDFWGEYTFIDSKKQINSVLGDGRSFDVIFAQDGEDTTVTEHFEAEMQNTLELQTMGWQSILDNFKKYVEEIQ